MRLLIDANLSPRVADRVTSEEQAALLAANLPVVADDLESPPSRPGDSRVHTSAFAFAMSIPATRS